MPILQMVHTGASREGTYPKATLVVWFGVSAAPTEPGHAVPSLRPGPIPPFPMREAKSGEVPASARLGSLPGSGVLWSGHLVTDSRFPHQWHRGHWAQLGAWEG